MSSTIRWGFVLVVLCVGGLFFFDVGQAGGKAKKPEGYRIYEQRIYYTHKGKLNDLHARFRNHTNALFVKHGMTLVGYWVPVDADDTLIYLLAYPSREAREKSWKAFINDPVWKKAFAESRKDGALVKKVESRFLIPTDYSPKR